MIIRSVRHRGLRRLIEDNDTRGIRSDLVNRVRNILAVLIVAENMEGVRGPPGWRIHQLRRPPGNVEHFRLGQLAHHL